MVAVLRPAYVLRDDKQRGHLPQFIMLIAVATRKDDLHLPLGSPTEWI